MTQNVSRRRLLTAAAAASVVGLRGKSAGAPEPATTPSPESAKRSPIFPPVDATRLAQRIARTLAPSAGERALLFFDPGYYPELVPAIEMELAASGVEHFLAAAFDPPEVVRVADQRPGAAGRQDDFVGWLAPVFAKADLFLWLPVRELYEDTRLEHLVDGSKVRGIHFHWLLDYEGRSPEEIASLSKLFERAILGTDYPALSREQDRLIGRLRGRDLRLTSPAGADLRLKVPSDAWFHKNDGDMSNSRAKTAVCARDREMELPAGALRFRPDPASVEGRLVVPRVPTSGGPAEGVTLDFEGGRVRASRAAKGEDAFRKQWTAIGGDVDRVGEIVIGTNPTLAKLPSGELPYFGYGAGAVRVSLGDNWESGGPLRTPGNRNWWLLLGDATLEAGGDVLIRDGRLLAG